MTHEEKNAWLFRKQKETLDRFLEHGAITKEQYNKSLHDLMEKMGMKELLKSDDLNQVSGGGGYGYDDPGWTWGTVHDVPYDGPDNYTLKLRVSPDGDIINHRGWENGEKIYIDPLCRVGDWIWAKADTGEQGCVDANYVWY